MIAGESHRRQGLRSALRQQTQCRQLLECLLGVTTRRGRVNAVKFCHLGGDLLLGAAAVAQQVDLARGAVQHVDFVARAVIDQILVTEIPTDFLLELADFLDIPIKTLYAWRYRGEGPIGFRAGKHLRYRWIDVEAWIEDRIQLARTNGRLDHIRS